MGPIHYKKNGWGFSSFLLVFLFFFSLYKFAQPSFARAPAQSPEHSTVAPCWPSSLFSPDGARKCPGSAPAPSWACPAPGRGPGPVAAAPSAAPLRAAWRCVPSGHLHGDLAPGPALTTEHSGSAAPAPSLAPGPASWSPKETAAFPFPNPLGSGVWALMTSDAPGVVVLCPWRKPACLLNSGSSPPGAVNRMGAAAGPRWLWATPGPVPCAIRSSLPSPLLFLLQLVRTRPPVYHARSNKFSYLSQQLSPTISKKGHFPPLVLNVSHKFRLSLAVHLRAG